MSGAPVTDWDRTWDLPTLADTLELGEGLTLHRVGEPTAELWQWAFNAHLVRLPRGTLRLVPVFPNEPIVLRLDRPLDLAPGKESVAWTGLPVDVQVEHMAPSVSGPGHGHGNGLGPGVVAVLARHHAPGLRRRLAVGSVDAPLIARTAEATLYSAPNRVPAGQAVIPLRFLHAPDALRTLDRILLPAGQLSLWAGRTVVYSGMVEVDLRESVAVGVRVVHEVPRGDVSLRSGPPPESGDFSLRSVLRSLTQIVQWVE